MAIMTYTDTETGTRTEDRQGVIPNFLRFFLLIIPQIQLLLITPTQHPWQRVPPLLAHGFEFSSKRIMGRSQNIFVAAFLYLRS